MDLEIAKKEHALLVEKGRATRRLRRFSYLFAAASIALAIVRSLAFDVNIDMFLVTVMIAFVVVMGIVTRFAFVEAQRAFYERHILKAFGHSWYNSWPATYRLSGTMIRFTYPGEDLETVLCISYRGRSPFAIKLRPGDSENALVTYKNIDEFFEWATSSS